MNPEMTPERFRVGDAERDEVTSALHEHFAQGRLDREELDERLSATLSARTAGDLREVVRDLPGSSDLAALSVPDGPSPAHLPWGPGPWGRGQRGRGPRGHGHVAYGPRGRGAAYGPLGHGPLGHGPAAYGHWDPAGRGHGHVGPHGWGPRRGKPFGIILLAAVIAAAVTGGWMIFPFFAVLWFGGAFLVMRHARRAGRGL